MEKQKETRTFEGYLGDLMWESDQYELVDQIPEDYQKHGWQQYTVIVKDKVTGQYFQTTGMFNDDEGWDDYDDTINLVEVFPVEKTIIAYE